MELGLKSGLVALNPNYFATTLNPKNFASALFYIVYFIRKHQYCSRSNQDQSKFIFKNVFGSNYITDHQNINPSLNLFESDSNRIIFDSFKILII